MSQKGRLFDMKVFQKLGRAVMLPVACLPLCGILMGIGYLLCPASMQGGDISGFLPLLGLYLVKAGGAVIDHIALLFAVGIGVGLSEDENGTAGITALISWLIITSLLNSGFVESMLKAKFLEEILLFFTDRTTAMLAFSRIENPFIGILAGIIGAESYNRFKNTSLPEWLAFFSRKRSTVIVSGMVSVAAAAILFIVWPILFSLLVHVGRWIAGLGAFGAGLYAFFNRLLIPFGLHHALNNVFWFDTIGLGDLTHFWAGHTSADVGWSLGMYMSGFFPCMMFGVPGAALAMLHCAESSRRRAAAGILGSAALCSFVCGITEPFEFAFMFISPGLYLIYAFLYGLFSFVTALTGFRAGFSFSAGVTDLLFSASLPAASMTWLILPLGLSAFAVFYLVFRFLIQRFHLPVVGREAEETDADALSVSANGFKESAKDEIVAGCHVDAILQGLGDRKNIVHLENCATRLRVEVKDVSSVDETMLKKAGAAAVMKTGGNYVQVIIGPDVQAVADALKPRLWNTL